MATLKQRKPDNLAYTKTKRVISQRKGESKTEQSQAQSADINYILKNYRKTGTMEHAKEFAGRYDDVTVNDFTEAMILTTEAKNMFDELPSHIRNLTGSPQGFLEFTQNPENKQQLIDLGLIEGNDGLDSKGAPSGAPFTPPPVEPPAEGDQPPA